MCGSQDRYLYHRTRLEVVNGEGFGVCAGVLRKCARGSKTCSVQDVADLVTDVLREHEHEPTQTTLFLALPPK